LRARHLDCHKKSGARGIGGDPLCLIPTILAGPAMRRLIRWHLSRGYRPFQCLHRLSDPHIERL
jgi:hypothetical protein